LMDKGLRVWGSGLGVGLVGLWVWALGFEGLKFGVWVSRA
jgi:hypothetical protein